MCGNVRHVRPRQAPAHGRFSLFRKTISEGPSLYFSPRGEMKCVRGPSGRGASRLARAGVLDGTLSTASKRNEVLAVVWRASAVGW